MQYDAAIHKWHTCKGTEPNSTNPCSEYVFLNNTACNLASLNLMKFKTPDGEFDVERFKAAVRIFITAQEIIVDNASYPTKEIAENSHIFRTLGLGYANLGSLIMSYGWLRHRRRPRALRRDHRHHDRPCLRAKRAIGAGDRAVSRLSRRPLPRRGEAGGEGQRRIDARRHRAAPRRRARNLSRQEFAYLKDEAATFGTAQRTRKAHGYRNAQVTVLAPTGTIAFLMDCDTTGIEPDIALVKYKLLAGGGMLKIVNRTVKPALEPRLQFRGDRAHHRAHRQVRHDRGRARIDRRRRFVIQRPEARASADLRLRVQAVQGKRSIHYLAHLRMMAAAQPFISGAISKTVNLPDEATVEDIINAYVRPGKWA